MYVYYANWCSIMQVNNVLAIPWLNSEIHNRNDIKTHVLMVKDLIKGIN